jgi:hypothetical protein
MFSFHLILTAACFSIYTCLVFMWNVTYPNDINVNTFIISGFKSDCLVSFSGTICIFSETETILNGTHKVEIFLQLSFFAKHHVAEAVYFWTLSCLIYEMEKLTVFLGFSLQAEHYLYLTSSCERDEMERVDICRTGAEKYAPRFEEYFCAIRHSVERLLNSLSELSVRLYPRSNSRPVGRIFMKFRHRRILRHVVQRLQF